MKSNVSRIMPPRVRRSIAKFGHDLAIARRKRRLTTTMMADRLGISRTTYVRVEKGDPAVGMGIYAMAMFALGMGAPLGELADVRKDEAGLQFDVQKLPKRVRLRLDRGEV